MRLTKRGNSSRGMTMVEMMVVVSIAAVLASVATVGTSSFIHSSRVNNAQKVLLAALTGARLRSITTQCSHFVQVNGPSYPNTASGPVGFMNRQGGVQVVRKAVCDSTTFTFEANDRSLDTASTDTDTMSGSVVIFVPTGLFSSTQLTSQAFTIGYDTRGNRFIWADASGTGSTGFQNVTTSVASMSVTAQDDATSTPAFAATILIPPTGAPK